MLFVGILNIIIHYWYCFLSTGIPDDLCTEAHRHTHKLTHTVIRTQWHTHTITHMHTVTHTHTQSTNVFLQSARPGQSTTVPEISHCQSDFPANSSESVQCLWWSANSETVSRNSRILQSILLTSLVIFTPKFLIVILVILKYVLSKVFFPFAYRFRMLHELSIFYFVDRFLIQCGIGPKLSEIKQNILVSFA